MDKWDRWLERKDWMKGEIPLADITESFEKVKESDTFLEQEKPGSILVWLIGIILLIGIPLFMYWLSTH